MNIVLSQKKEIIHVIHNNVEEMRVNVENLQSDGWSTNIRMSHTESIREEDIPALKEKYPQIEVEYPKKGNFLHSSPYVYLTEHEREINE